MEISAYKDYSNVENKHWWHVGRRVVLGRVINNFLSGNDIEILSVGCGTGAELEFLKQYGRVTGVDREDALKYAQNVKGVKLFAGELPNLEFGDNLFDLVVCSEVLEHLEDDKAGLAELNRVLKPGGQLLITVPAFRFLWSDHDEISHHKRRYRKKMLQNLIIDSGLRVRFASYFNFFLFPPVLVAAIVSKFLPISRSKLTFSMPPKLINSAFKSIFSFEQFFVLKPGLPFGSSIAALASKN